MWTGANDTDVLWPARKVIKKLKHDGQVTFLSGRLGYTALVGTIATHWSEWK